MVYHASCKIHACQEFHQVIFDKTYLPMYTQALDTVQDFLIKLGIKPHMHLWEISILSLNNVIVRPTKIMNRADKNWAHF